MAPPLLTHSFLVPGMNNVAKTAIPRKVMVSSCLRAMWIKLHEKSEHALKQASVRFSALFPFHFLLLPIDSPLHHSTSQWGSLFAKPTSCLCLFLFLHQSLYLSNNTLKDDRIFSKIYPRVRTFGSQVIQVPKQAHTGDSCENHKQANGISETVLEQDSLHFVLCRAHSGTSAPLAADVYLQNDPCFSPQFLSGFHSIFVIVFKRPNAAFPNILPPHQKTQRHSLFQLLF